MTENEKNKGPLYVYCHDCETLLAKCYDISSAHVVCAAHRKDEHSGCTVTTGNKYYFDNVFPHIELEPNKVLLTVLGGVVDLVNKPFGIEVEIRDFDVEGIDAEGDERCKKDSNGDWYQEMLWESTVEVL